MTDKKLERAQELKKLIKECDDFALAIELNEWDDPLTTITVSNTKRSASMHVCRFANAAWALRDAMREEYRKLTKEYEDL